MPQNDQDITKSPEFKEFCKKNNLEVYDFDAIRIFLFETFCNYKEGVNGFFDHDERITKLEEENKKLREMINEIAKNTIVTLPNQSPPITTTLFAYWKENGNN